MQLDVRTPAGVMFVVLGALLLLYGALSDPAVYQRSLGVNINLYWGAVLMAFGAALLIWRRLSLPITTEPVCDDGPRPTVNGPR
jgi:protein-S-isoprenylcysteine O-methyltransferase Ste14